jgi:hypothetical protein
MAREEIGVARAHDPNHECARIARLELFDDRLAGDDVADMLDQKDSAKGPARVRPLQSRNLANSRIGVASDSPIEKTIAGAQPQRVTVSPGNSPNPRDDR